MRIIRITKVEAEKIISSLIGEKISLLEGKNNIKYKKKVNTCTLDVSFEIILPSFQHNAELICFFDEKNLEVNGRGSKTYGNKIIFEVVNMFYEARAKYVFLKDNDCKGLVIGYTKSNKNVDIYKATHINIEYVNYKEDRYIDMSISHSAELEMTDMSKIIRYQNKTNKNWNSSKIAIVRADGVYVQIENYSIKYYEDLISSISTMDEFYIFDNKGRIWKKTAFTKLIREIEASYVQDGVEELIVVEDILYSHIGILADFRTKELILFKNKLYKEVEDAEVVFARGDLIPLFDTNIKSLTPIKGKGLYSMTKFNGNNVVIVPISSSYFSDFNTGKIKIMVVNKSIYTFVGDYKDVGFGSEEIGWHRGNIKVMQRPENQHESFYECYNDIPAKYLEAEEKITIEFFDKKFKGKAPEFVVGDTVLINKEPTNASQLKGLTAIIKEISNNKKVLSLKLFNFFNLQLDTDYVQKF